MLVSVSFKRQAAHIVYKIVAVPRLSKKRNSNFTSFGTWSTIWIQFIFWKQS